MERNKLLSFDSTIYFLFKKKKKKKNVLKNRISLDLLNKFKLVLFFNTFVGYFHYNMSKFFFVKVFWKFFLILYNIMYGDIKMKIKNFFNNFLLKKIIKKIFDFRFQITGNGSFLYLKKLKLKNIFNSNFPKCYITKKKRKKIKAKIFVERLLKKSLRKHINIKKPLFFFNKYKKDSFFLFVKYFIKFFNVDIEKKLFIMYWKNYYTYVLKRIYLYIEYLIRKISFFLISQYKLFISLICWKKKKINKRMFFYLFFFSSKKRNFLKNFRVYSIYDQAYKLLSLGLYKKKTFSLFLFNNIRLKRYDLVSVLKRVKTKLSFFKPFIIVKFLINIKNIFYIFFFQLLIIWLNNFLSSKVPAIAFRREFLTNYNEISVKFKKSLVFFRNLRWLRFNFFGANYILYNNIKKSG